MKGKRKGSILVLHPLFHVFSVESLYNSIDSNFLTKMKEDDRGFNFIGFNFSTTTDKK